MVSLHCPPGLAPGVQGSRPLFSRQLLLAAPPIAGLLPAHVPSSQPEPPPASPASLLFDEALELPPAQYEAARAAAQALLDVTCQYLLKDLRQSEYLPQVKHFIQTMLFLRGQAASPDIEVSRAEESRPPTEQEQLRARMAETDLKVARVIINHIKLNGVPGTRRGDHVQGE